MTELSALHVLITGSDKGLAAALGSAQKGVERFSKSAETSAKVFERAFAGSEKAIDGLRRSIDPVYAASKRYEAAVETLDNALKMGTISQQAHTKMLEQASAAYLKAQGGATGLHGKLGFLGGMTDQTRNRLQQMSFQLQDVAVQLSAGTRATTVFAQQGSQMLSVFGPVGAALGLLAAVGLPALGAAFGTAGDNAKSFEDQLGQLKTSTSELKAITDLYSLEGLQSLKDKYGEVTPEVLRMVDALRQQKLAQMELDAQASIRSLVDQYGLLAINLDAVGQAAKAPAMQLYQLQTALGLGVDEARQLVAAFQELNKAPLADKPRILSEIRTLLQGAKGDTTEWIGAVNAAEDAIRQANAEGAKAGGWLSAAITGAQDWASALWDAADAAAAARGAAASPQGAGMGRGSSPGGPLVGSADLAAIQAGGGVWRTAEVVRPTRSGGGGGGGGSNPYQAEVEALRQSLLTKEEAEIASYTKRQEALQKYLDTKMITEDEYRRLSEESQRQHSEKMAELDAWRYGTGLDKAGAFFGGMADAMQGGNERMLAISKKFAAAEALINAWKGFSDVLADKTLPWYAKIPQAMAVLKAGMGAVNAIKGGGGGGAAAAAGGSGSAGAGRSEATIGTYMNFTFQGGMVASEQVGRFMVEAINKAVENGAVIKGARVV